MAMRMLEAGGLPVVTDGARRPDDSNPNGYYEYELVKLLDKGGDASWLSEASGKAVKIISFLLTYLPETYHYKVLFMHRDIGEVIASQNRMLDRRGASRGATDDETRLLYEQHLAQVEQFLSNRRCFSTLRVSYNQTVASPGTQVAQINAFLGGTFDELKMAAVADAALYRNRGKAEA